MGRKQKIDLTLLDEMLRVQGKTQAYCAEFFGVSRAAIGQAKQKLSIAMSRTIVAKQASHVIDKNLNAVDQLQKINNSANNLLDELIAVQANIPENCKHIAKDENGIESEIIDYKLYAAHLKGARELSLKAMAEIRGQLKLQLEIFQCLYDMEAVKAFQEEVVAIIGEVSPDARTAIIARLNKASHVRRATQPDRA
jgi:hypothetical protein